MSAVGDARKRLAAAHLEHPDPAVRDLLNAARAEAWDRGWLAGLLEIAVTPGTTPTPNPYRSTP